MPPGLLCADNNHLGAGAGNGERESGRGRERNRERGARGREGKRTSFEGWAYGVITLIFEPSASYVHAFWWMVKYLMS